MQDLYDISKPDESYQRNLIDDHKEEMIAFLDDSHYLFYPELILGGVFENAKNNEDKANEFITAFNKGNSCNCLFKNFRIQFSADKIKVKEEARNADYFRRAVLTIKDKDINSDSFKKFARIDGNHRLSATPERENFKQLNTPFCLILFRNQEESDRYSRALFHNINYKSVPLTMEQNLRLILDDEKNLFPDEELKDNASFGWPYYLARKLYGKIDYDMIPNIHSALDKEERTFLVEELSWLIEAEILGENENAVKRFKQALVEVNTLYGQYVALAECKNRGLLGAFIYFQLKPEKLVKSFAEWVIDNHIHTIEKSHSKDIVKVFESILNSRKHTIFVSMKFNNPKTDNHYKIIERTTEEINKEFGLKVKLKPERVDWFNDGTSYEINNKILKMISDCGLLIGNLTFCNPNVYHEIGFLMGKNKAVGDDFGSFLLFLDESVKDKKCVGFNLAGIKQIRFTESEDFASELKKHLIKFFKLS